MAVAWALSLLPDLYDLFGENGVAPYQQPRPYQWGVFDVWTSDRALLIGGAVLLASAVAMTVGWHSRLAAIIVCVSSSCHSNGAILGSLTPATSSSGSRRYFSRYLRAAPHCHSIAAVRPDHFGRPRTARAGLFG